MADERVVMQPAYVLHRRPYRDTSLLLEMLTQEHGRAALVARGARQPRSRLRAVMQPFTPLLISWSGRGDLATLTAAEPAGGAAYLEGEALLAAFYLNEVLLRVLTRWDPYPEVFSSYVAALEALRLQGCEPIVLRRFELTLLEALGYGVPLQHDASGDAIRADIRYLFDAERGLLPLSPNTDSGAAVDGQCLQAMADDASIGGECLKQMRRLLQAALQPHLGPRPLRSRELLLQMRRRASE